MGRLIDADRLKAHYCWWSGGTKEMTIDEAKKTFDTIIDVQPTVDAEPVVRCKECKHYVTGGYCGIVNERYNEDEFCSRGEEKEDEEEPITPEMFAEKMRGIANRYYGDEEMGHIQADGLMIVLLEQLGYKEGAEIFDNMAKWYS